jgi:hypothetical protein
MESKTHEEIADVRFDVGVPRYALRLLWGAERGVEVRVDVLLDAIARDGLECGDIFDDGGQGRHDAMPVR